MRAVCSFDLLFNGLERSGRSSKKKNLKILNSINQVMFNELGFKKLPYFHASDYNLYSNFQQVCLATLSIWLKCNADEVLMLFIYIFLSP